VYHQCVHCVKQRYFIRSILTIVRSVCACKGKKKENSSLGEEMNGYYRVLTLIIEAVVHSIARITMLARVPITINAVGSEKLAAVCAVALA
jgi:hypothetical protein